MININEQQIKEQLSKFDSVWRRVNSSKNLKDSADQHGVKLMPKKNCRKPKNRFR